MVSEGGAQETRALVFAGGSGDEGRGAALDGPRCGVPGWPRVRLLAALSASCAFALLGLAGTGRWRAATRARHSGGHLPLQAMWMINVPSEAAMVPEFRTGDIIARSNLCLGARQQMAEGRPALIHCSEGNTKGTWIWETTRGTLQHRESNLGFCLDAPRPEMVGSGVRLRGCTPGVSRQMWDIIAERGLLRNRITGKCVIAENPALENTSLSIQECSSASRQWRWSDDTRVEDVNPGFVLRDGWRGKIRNKNGTCMRAANSRKKGSDIWMADCDSEADGMYWSYSGTTSSLLSPDGYCLDFNQNWNRLHLWQCYPELNAQKFGYDPRTGLIVAWGGKCLDAPEPNLRLHFCKVFVASCAPHNPAQQWILQG